MTEVKKVIMVVVLGVIVSIAIPQINISNQTQKLETENTQKTETTTSSNEVAIATPTINESGTPVEETSVEQTKTTPQTTTPDPVVTEEPQESQAEPIVFDGLTLTELTEKLNRSLHSTLSNTGSSFANYAIEMGIDPYLAVAIVLHETGCNSSCSKQVRQCYNVGGMKGGPSCNGTSYKRFNSLDEGIYVFMSNLKKNYYDKGLNTPEKMNKKYAASTSWATKVHHYINKIKAS